MINILKKLNIINYLEILAALVALAGYILLLVTNSIQGYAIGESPALLVTFDTLGVIAIVAALTLKVMNKPNWISSLLILVALITFGFNFGYVLYNRVALAANLLTFDGNNVLGWLALKTSIAEIVLFVISSILFTATGFFKTELSK
jgi:hypothetical protein